MRRLFLILLLLASSAWATEPGIYNPNVYQGESFSRTLTWRDGAGDLVDLTGYTARLDITHTPIGSTSKGRRRGDGDVGHDCGSDGQVPVSWPVAVHVGSEGLKRDGDVSAPRRSGLLCALRVP